MKYATFIVTEGAMPEDALQTMNREWPAYEEKLSRRGLWQLGRELDLPEEGAATVRVRDGQTLVNDGPFIETKEFVAGIQLLECTDLEDAIAVQSENPVVRFNPFEIRPFAQEPTLTERAAAFGRGEDGGGEPYLLLSWADGTGAPIDAPACLAWRSDLDSGVLVLGGLLSEPASARTLRFADGELRVQDGPFLDIRQAIVAIDVVYSPGLAQATALAATHPLALEHAIEVRPFYTE